MDVKSRGGQQRSSIHSSPRQVPGASSAGQPIAHAAAKAPVRTSKRNNKKNILGVLLAIILLASAIFAWFTITNRVNASRYQAVFLTNGQVYFGKLHGYYGGRPYMTEVYYFQSASGSADTKMSSQQQLRKLGTEVHGPEQELLLNRDSILFVENLREDSNIVSAIVKESESGTIVPSGDAKR